MTNLAEKRIKFSIRVMIVNSKDQVLLGLKKKGFNANTWIFPGGQMDFGETIAECGKREVWEETTLDVQIAGLIDVVTETKGEKHVTFINVLAKGEGIPVVTEPHEVIDWNWFNQHELPCNTTSSVQNAILKIKQGQPVIPVD